MVTHRQRTAAGIHGIDPETLAENEAKGLKYCGGCKQWLPAKESHFYMRRDRRLLNTCRGCRLAGAGAGYKRQLREILKGGSDD